LGPEVHQDDSLALGTWWGLGETDWFRPVFQLGFPEIACDLGIAARRYVSDLAGRRCQLVRFRARLEFSHLLSTLLHSSVYYTISLRRNQLPAAVAADRLMV
jgi:hypothetical protein